MTVPQDPLIKKIVTRLNHECHGAKCINKWTLCKEGGGFSIKRWIVYPDRKTFQRLPIDLYKAIRTDPFQLDKMIRRLNHQPTIEEETAKEAFLLSSAFIPGEILDGFRERLITETPSPEVINRTYGYVIKHFLSYFLPKDPDPQIWYKKYRDSWATYLLSTKYSIDTMDKIVQAANRFMRYLHEQREKEIPLLIFTPFNKVKKIDMNEEKKAKAKEKRFYVKPRDFEVIRKYLKETDSIIYPVFMLCYYYGLRRSECLGLYGRKKVLSADFLLIDRQKSKHKPDIKPTKPTKNKKKREVSHWFCSAEECGQLIKQLPKILVDKATEEMNKVSTSLFRDKRISNKYTLQDCRHTWITNAVKTHDLNIVRACAGHESISTTNGYLKDWRDMDRIWIL